MALSFEIKLEGSMVDASVARRAIKHLIQNESDMTFLSDAVLMTSELITNAIQHTNDSSVLRAEFVERILRVEVTDGCDAVPEPGAVEPTAVAGRGLRLVNDLATRWGPYACGAAKRCGSNSRPPSINFAPAVPDAAETSPWYTDHASTSEPAFGDTLAG
jgi:hypothetical protein